MNYSQIQVAIQTAFQGVILDGGVSVRQAEVMDNWGRGITNKEFQALPLEENTENWMALSGETLEQFPYLSYLDAKGFRFYIPAFMLSVLASYQPSSLRVISTLSSLYPKQDTYGEHSLNQYSLLNQEQRSAIASFLSCLPATVPLDLEDQRIVERAIRNYWHEYL